MYLEQSIREKFAERIIEAAGYADVGKDKAEYFQRKFANLEGLKIKASNLWMDKVVSWTREHHSEMADLIKKNYDNPQEVLTEIIEHIKPI